MLSAAAAAADESGQHFRVQPGLSEEAGGRSKGALMCCIILVLAEFGAKNRFPQAGGQAR